ncbi:dynamin family protein [Cohnella faecalis]|uniref:Dynamin n=1 Tax=Cohnella faecalis TaxID=2315694 RepID=A0A398CTW3_9BACL|nr:dynamin family protein [Cohnella faecalis]RIE04709.1 dynamin [Cohnella faecalis]
MSSRLTDRGTEGLSLPGTAAADPLVAKYRLALEEMARHTEEMGDAVQAEKFAELVAKLAKERLTCAFCGHFSAGKSTLVNALCGAELLPSSPIPTSANVVTIASGEPSARMVFRDKDGHVSEPETFPVDRLHGFAVDGEGVASIEVTYPIPLLGDHVAIVDTPGVDSTDGAHRAATESALHLADVVFYVTDYNHVLSEVNFRFLRSLAKWGKPTYVIVNQVDKHREEEVSFAAFRAGLNDAMEQWRIEPAGILFLSLREKDHPLSQWRELTGLFARLAPYRTELAVASAERSARYLSDQFRETLHNRRHSEREKLQLVLGAEGAELVAARKSELTAKLAAVKSASDLRREALKRELDRLLGNASLTPAETRDKVRDVLEGMQPGFKIGWIGSAAKTQAERERRLSVLTADLNRQISANVNGHVRTLLRQTAKEAGLNGTDEANMEASLEAAFPELTDEWIRQRIKPGAGADGQATLTFSSELSSDIKAMYRKQSMEWNDRLEESRKPEREAAERELLQQLKELEPQSAAAAELAAMSDEEREEQRKLLLRLPVLDEAVVSKLAELPSPQPLNAEALAKIAGENERGAAALSWSDAAGSRRMDEGLEEAAEIAADGTTERQPDEALGVPNGAAERLGKAAELLSRIPALARTAEGLAAKAERLRRSRFTIALFGAFSAGKSSFANALVGAPALPVSPNPTTATINRILAPEEGKPHGTALVTMKAMEAMLEDIRHSLGRLGIARDAVEAAGNDASALFALAAKMSPDEVHPRGRPHLAFLRAASNGWPKFSELLDTKFLADHADYRRYAAEEETSCFVAEIDLFVDSPLTRSGAVLVDTPGADSINARHTGVSFEYIKNADAVLFVTYYNHAFTEADRQFLNQLGSVKDVFELDKMFFVINAADLASSETELKAVEEHVATQLLKHGIRKPRLFPVSSLHGLKAKLARDAGTLESSGLTAFEREFRHFAASELGGLALNAANKELERAGLLLEGFARSAEEDGVSRAAKADRLLAKARAWREEGSSSAIPETAVQPLVQEIGEQLYHLRQRVYYRFNEHFQSAFHPSALQDDGRDLKAMLTACGDDLTRSLGEDFQQELRSSGLRLEITVQKLLEERIALGAAALAEEGFVPEQPDRGPLTLPIGDPFADRPVSDGRKLWSAFRSPKHFFEKDGKKAMREELESIYFQAADDYLAKLKNEWNDSAIDGYRSSLKEASERLAAELSAFAQSLGESMSKPGEEAILSDVRAAWNNL